MICRVCGGDQLTPSQPCRDDATVTFHRCWECFSESSTADPATVARLYTDERYRDHNLTKHDHSLDRLVEACRANQQWFDDYAPTVPGPRTFLDVGCNEGAMLDGMRRRGWAVSGFDVNPTCAGGGVVIAPAFRADLFPGQFAAVNCRDVLEHVDDWRGMLRELAAATRPGGLCQVQTPRPWHVPHPDIYQTAHLQIFSPSALWTLVADAGFVVRDRWLWGSATVQGGQALLLRRPA